jgi:hypothetical protein
MAAGVGMRLSRDKRSALAECSGLLIRACDELDALLTRGAIEGFDVDDVEELGPVALRVTRLRERQRRLQAELRAIDAEWTGG